MGLLRFILRMLGIITLGLLALLTASRWLSDEDEMWLLLLHTSPKGEIDLYRWNIETDEQQHLAALVRVQPLSDMMVQLRDVSPSGREFYFVVEDFWNNIGTFYAETTYRARIDGSKADPLSNPTDFRRMYAAWYPGNQSLLVHCGGNLCEDRMDGSPLRQITHTTTAAQFARWSLDGEWLYFNVEDAGFPDLYRVQRDGSQQQKLTGSTGAELFGGWSPSGKWIFFTGGLSGQHNIYRMRPDGTEIQNLTHDPHNAWFNSLSPDGEWIIFTSSRRNDQTAELYRMRLDGSDVQRLAPRTLFEGHQMFLAWSPDGQWMVFQQLGEFYRMHADGSELQQITYFPAENPRLNFHSWSPDSQWIIITSPERIGGSYEIYRTRADGSQIYRLARAPDVHDYIIGWQQTPTLIWHRWIVGGVGLTLMGMASASRRKKSAL